MACVALKLVSWRMSPFQVGFMACVALRLVFTAFCQVCSTACSPKFIFMAFVALFLTPCVTSQVSFMAYVTFQVGFMACVALKLVSTAFCQVCFTACSLKFIFMAYVALFFTAFVASQISFMACVALKLVFLRRFVLKFVFKVCSLRFIFLAYVALVLMACVAFQVASHGTCPLQTI